MQKLGAENGFAVTTTDDATAFTADNLAHYDAVVFVSTTGEVLNADQKQAFQAYIEGGGGFVGIHAASDGGGINGSPARDWEWYDKTLLGARFRDHANFATTATIKVLDAVHPSAKDLGPTWQHADEYYAFTTDPRDAGVHVLAEVDEGTWQRPADQTDNGGKMGAEHPIAWCKNVGDGQSWYTALGHEPSTYTDASFLKHLLGGIESAAGMVPADCTATIDSSFDVVKVNTKQTAAPMQMAIDAVGTLYVVERAGDVKRFAPDGTETLLGHFDVTQDGEGGLLSIALDPGFAENRRIFMYWSPAATIGKHRLSQFTLSPDSKLVDEKIVLEVDVVAKAAKLNLPLTATDLHAGSTNVPSNIILQTLPAGGFTAYAKVSLDAQLAYQQAGLVLYGGDDDYIKMVLQGRSSQPDSSARVFQVLREQGGAPVEVNTPALGASFPKDFWVRLASADGTSVQASYSADGKTFTEVGDPQDMSFITEPRIGLLAMANNEAAAKDVVASFDKFYLTPDDRSRNDEFSNDQVSDCLWNASVRRDPATSRVADGVLTIDTSAGDIMQSTNTDPKNFILQKAPEGDWTVETKLDATAFSQAYHQGGLIAYLGDDDYVKLDLVALDSAGGRQIELRNEIGAKWDGVQPSKPTDAQTVYLRMTKRDTKIGGEYSVDGETWVALPAVTNPAMASADLKVGVFAFGATQQDSAAAKFDYVRWSPARDIPDVPVDPVAKLAVKAEAAATCTGKKAVVEVTVTNEEKADISVDIASPSENSSIKKLGPGKSKSVKLKSKAASIDATTVTVTATGVQDGKEVTTELRLDVPATTCR